MAMLAEKREKKVIRSYMLKSKPLSSESCKVGQRLLEKMGWTPGKGLGVKEDGCPDPLRVKYKCDIRGLGFKENEKDALSCQEGFSDLLASLSQHTDYSPAPTTLFKEENSLNSLELVSKKSRARVHYKKFTRGKDLSQASSKDLASILGISAERSSEAVSKNSVKALPSSLDNQISDGGVNESLKRKRESSSVHPLEILGINDCNLENKSVGKNKKKKKKLEADGHSSAKLDHSEFINENLSGSGRRKSVTWGDVEVSFVSKYISEMVDTSSESVKDDDPSSTWPTENCSDVSSIDKKPMKKKKEKKSLFNKDNLVLEVESKAKLPYETVTLVTKSSIDLETFPLSDTKQRKKKKRSKNHLEDDYDLCGKVSDCNSVISLPEANCTHFHLVEERKGKKLKKGSTKDSKGSLETHDFKSNSRETDQEGVEELNNSSSTNILKVKEALEFISMSQSSEVARNEPLCSKEIDDPNIKIKKKDHKKKKNRELKVSEDDGANSLDLTTNVLMEEHFEEQMSLKEGEESKRKKKKKSNKKDETSINIDKQYIQETNSHMSNEVVNTGCCIPSTSAACSEESFEEPLALREKKSNKKNKEKKKIKENDSVTVLDFNSVPVVCDDISESVDTNCVSLKTSTDKTTVSKKKKVKGGMTSDFEQADEIKDSTGWQESSGLVNVKDKVRVLPSGGLNSNENDKEVNGPNESLGDASVPFTSLHKERRRLKSAKETIGEDLPTGLNVEKCGENFNESNPQDEKALLNLTSPLSDQDDAQPLSAQKNQLGLSLLTKQRMEKWKKRHKNSHLATLNQSPNPEIPACRIENVNSNNSDDKGTSEAAFFGGTRRSAKKYGTLQLHAIHFEGSNLESIKGYGFSVTV